MTILHLYKHIEGHRFVNTKRYEKIVSCKNVLAFSTVTDCLLNNLT